MSYLSLNITNHNLRFGQDPLSQLLWKGHQNSFDPTGYATLQRAQLPQNTLFQILQIQDTSISQAQELESLRELESETNLVTDKLSKNVNRRKPRVITKIAEDNNATTTITKTKCHYKFLLQDSKGHLCYAIELESLNFIKLNSVPSPIPLGSKIIIKLGATILRGCLLVGNQDCIFLGGELSVLNGGYSRRRMEELERSMKG